MKKTFLSLVFSFFLVNAFALEEESNCNGPVPLQTCENTLEVWIQISQNCCKGYIDIVDCDAGAYRLINEEDGPNSSCGIPEV
jgi:hypothetical protein